MLLIRVFLWGLVAAMTLQGFLHADEYGTAATLFGGMALTMSAWGERLSEGARALFWREPKYVALPRSVVIAALRETARHPGLHTLPPLRAALAEHEASWQEFREAEVEWLLAHGDLIGGLATEGRSSWSDAAIERDLAAGAVTEAKERLCRIPRLDPAKCSAAAAALVTAQGEFEKAERRADAWERVLRMTSVGRDAGPDTLEWLLAVAGLENATVTAIEAFRAELETLHDVRTRRDGRLRELRRYAAAVGDTLVAAVDAEVVVATDAAEVAWQSRLTTSLLTGEIWAACMRHVRRRESRVRELMAATGVQDLYNAQERVLNASLRVAATAAERQTVMDWFGEIAGYAWWPGDDLPAIVRRCLVQQGGDCRRIGPTEVTALTSQMDEQARIVADWTRRLFIGMWNALPAVGLLFIVETVVLVLGIRRTQPVQMLPAPAPAPMLEDDYRRPVLEDTYRRPALRLLPATRRLTR
jgi:hypothetical protein